MEAFFLVYSALTQPEEKKKIHLKETRQEQLAHIQEQLEPPQLGQTDASNAQPSTSTGRYKIKLWGLSDCRSNRKIFLQGVVKK